MRNRNRNNEAGSSLLMITVIMVVLMFAGIFLIRSVGTSLNIAGFERKRLIADEVLQAAFADLMSCEASLKRTEKILPEIGDEAEEFINRASVCHCSGYSGEDTLEFINTYPDYTYRYDASFIRASAADGESLHDTRSYIYKIKIMIYGKNELETNYPCAGIPGIATAPSRKSLTVRLSKLGQKSLNYDGGEEITQ